MLGINLNVEKREPYKQLSDVTQYNQCFQSPALSQL